MTKIIRRSSLVAAAFAPIAALSLVNSAIGSAQPLACPEGQFWDPINNTCQTPRPAAQCGFDEYWNPVSNLCRPLGQI